VAEACEPRHWIRLTYACNNRCLFCLDGGNELPDGMPPEGVPFGDLAADMGRARAAGLRRIVLSGGEPTLHPRFPDIVGEASRLGFTHVQVITNGRRFCYPGFLDRCLREGLREATFSMHGHTAALHDRLVGTPGAFVQSLTGLLNALRRPELIVSVDVVLNRLNIERLEEMLRFYIRLGVREFDLLQIIPFGRSWDTWGDLCCDLDEHAERFRAALELSRTVPGLHLWTNRLAARHLEGFESLIQAPEKIFDEIRGRGALFREFVERGTPLPCKGERCRFCFLEGYCADLDLLLARGSLEPDPPPPCLPGGDSSGAGFRREELKPDLEAWTRFYIARRYGVKGRGCGGCARTGRCAGAPIAAVRAEGFAILKPFSKGERG